MAVYLVELCFSLSQTTGQYKHHYVLRWDATLAQNHIFMSGYLSGKTRGKCPFILNNV